MDSQFTPRHLQCAFFLSLINLSSKMKIANAVAKLLPEIFDKDPLFLEIDKSLEVDGDVPEVIMENSKNAWALRIGKSRMDLFAEPTKHDEKMTLSNFIDIFQEVAIKIFEMQRDSFSLISYRIGFITHLVCLTENAVDLVSKKYTTNLIEPEETSKLELHFLKKYNREGMDLNRWTRIRSRIEENEVPSQVNLEVDINTPNEKKVVLDSDFIQKFFSVAKSEILDIAKKHEAA